MGLVYGRKAREELTIRFHGLNKGKRVHDQREKSPHQQYPIGK